MATTRLGQIGVGVEPYGTFSPKDPAPSTGPHNPGLITRLAQFGVGVSKYGTFQPKSAAPEPEPQPDVQSSKGMYDEPAFLRGVRRKKDKKRKPLREELIEAFAEIRVVPELAPQVAAAVAEYVIQKPGPRPAVPAVERVDWAALRADLDAVRLIFELYARLEARRRDEEDDDDLMLLH